MFLLFIEERIMTIENNLPSMPRNPVLVEAARALLTSKVSSSKYRMARHTLARASGICDKCVSDALIYVNDEIPADASLDDRADELVAACDMVADDPLHDHE
jgi:hypothetical protein